MKARKLLVDTSAWILSFRKTGFEELKSLLREAIDKEYVVITPFIMLELLQGCTTRKEFRDLKERLETLEICSIHDLNWGGLFELGFLLRRKGLTIPTLDMIEAFLCMEKGYALVHHDHHFRMIAEHTGLRTIDYLD